ncbi:hypothetical protein FGO68_gene1214 [Halteria grandinella]|uniref:Uncharacterized protein n=1 Tax=Halteria grandinella TaxID=5974 RepID=A0A8J8NYK3_HALGN|nr:hypothetical protein FGO68_gene1214 [Halteria grandinella]
MMKSECLMCLLQQQMGNNRSRSLNCCGSDKLKKDPSQQSQQPYFMTDEMYQYQMSLNNSNASGRNLAQNFHPYYNSSESPAQYHQVQSQQSQNNFRGIQRKYPANNSRQNTKMQGSTHQKPSKSQSHHQTPQKIPKQQEISQGFDVLYGGGSAQQLRRRRLSSNTKAQQIRQRQDLTYFLTLQNLNRFNPAQLVLAKFEYYEDIQSLVRGIEFATDDSDGEEALIENLLAVIETEKREHHQILVCMFQFFTLVEILRLSRVNRKLYIVSGDTQMLRKNYMRGNERRGSQQQRGGNMRKTVGNHPEEYIYQVVANASQKRSKNFESSQGRNRIDLRSIAMSDHQSQGGNKYDIILDRRGMRAELQNQFFALNSSKGSSSAQLSIGPPSNWYHSNHGENEKQAFQRHVSNKSKRRKKHADDNESEYGDEMPDSARMHSEQGEGNYDTNNLRAAALFFQQQRRTAFSLKPRNAPLFAQNAIENLPVKIQDSEHRSGGRNNSGGLPVYNNQLRQLNRVDQLSNQSNPFGFQSSRRGGSIIEERPAIIRRAPVVEQSQESMIRQINAYVRRSNHQDETQPAYFRRATFDKKESNAAPPSGKGGNSVKSSQDEGSLALFSQRTPSFVQKMRESIMSHKSNMLANSGSKGEDYLNKQTQQRNKNGSKIFQSRESIPEIPLPLGQIQQDYKSIIHPISSKHQGQSNISIKDFLNIKLCEGAVLTVQTPGGTKATIMPMNQAQQRTHKKHDSKQFSSLFLEKVQNANEERKQNVKQLHPYLQQSSAAINPVSGDSPSPHPSKKNSSAPIYIEDFSSIQPDNNKPIRSLRDSSFFLSEEKNSEILKEEAGTLVKSTIKDVTFQSSGDQQPKATEMKVTARKLLKAKIVQASKAPSQIILENPKE